MGHETVVKVQSVEREEASLGHTNLIHFKRATLEVARRTRQMTLETNIDIAVTNVISLRRTSKGGSATLSANIVNNAGRLG